MQSFPFLPLLLYSHITKRAKCGCAHWHRVITLHSNPCGTYKSPTSFLLLMAILWCIRQWLVFLGMAVFIYGHFFQNYSAFCTSWKFAGLLQIGINRWTSSECVTRTFSIKSPPRFTRMQIRELRSSSRRNSKNTNAIGPRRCIDI